MQKIALYEPALCCSTGVCGPSVDANLIRITAVMQELRKTEHVRMIRYNLAQNPNAFVRNQEVNRLLQEKGIDCLPVTVWEDQVVLTGTYPTNEEIAQFTGVSLQEHPLPSA